MLGARLCGAGLAAVLLATAPGCGAPTAELELRSLDPFSQRLRPTNPGALFSFDSGATVLSHDSTGGRFKIWYATDTSDAVPLADDDQSGVPDFVELAADTFDQVITHYVDTLGFRPPVDDTAVGAADDGGDARFDVYLVDFAGMGDGAFGLDGCLTGTNQCAGHMSVENDFAGYGYPSYSQAITILASHEFFHAIQAAYDAEQSSWWTESTAVWATEMFDPAQPDFEWFIHGYLDLTEQSMDVPPVGPVDSFSYGLAIWARFLSERFDPDLIRQIWEGLVDGAGGVADPEPLGVIDALLVANHQSSYADAFAEFATWNLYNGRFASSGVGYQGAAGYDEVEIKWYGELPYQDDLRLFYASARYYSADLQELDQFTVGLADDAPSEDVRVAVVLERGFDRGAPIWMEQLYTTAPTVIDSSGEDRAIAVVVNVATSGQSQRPTLCLGAPEDVATCVDPGGTSDDAGPGSGGDTPPPEDCACRGGAPLTSPLLALALLLGAARRRRR